MSATGHRTRLSVKAIAAAKPAAKEYTLWDNQLAHFGVRVLPSGVKSYIVQTRANGRMRKITLGRFSELRLGTARREGAAVLARLWGGEDVTPRRKKMAPLFRSFAARYRERRKHRWKPSTLETFDIYLRNRLMPHFGKLRLDAIDHARVSAWFDAASVDKPGAANRAFEILRAMLVSARQWGDLPDRVPNACANIVKNPRRPVARYLDRAELKRLGQVLDRHQHKQPWRVAAIWLLTLTGAGVSEVLNLRWNGVGELRTVQASALKTPRPDRAPSGSDQKRQTFSRNYRETRGRRGCSRRTSRRIGSIRSGSESVRKRVCPDCACMTAGILGHRRA